MANPPPVIDLDKYDYENNEVLIFTPLYNTKIVYTEVSPKKLCYITLRGDTNESLYSYGYDKEKSTVLFCTNKQPPPNIFQ